MGALGGSTVRHRQAEQTGGQEEGAAEGRQRLESV